MAGLAAGQLFFGPMSDKYGRKAVLVWTLLLFIATTLLCILSNDIQMFVILRLLQGIGAAGSIVIAHSISTDIFEGRDLAKILAIVGSINGIAPVLAPVAGGMITGTAGWKGAFVILLFIGILFSTACILYQESLPAEKRFKINLTHVISYFKPLLKTSIILYISSNWGLPRVHFSPTSLLLRSSCRNTTDSPHSSSAYVLELMPWL